MRRPAQVENPPIHLGQQAPQLVMMWVAQAWELGESRPNRRLVVALEPVAPRGPAAPVRPESLPSRRLAMTLEPVPVLVGAQASASLAQASASLVQAEIHPIHPRAQVVVPVLTTAATRLRRRLQETTKK